MANVARALREVSASLYANGYNEVAYGFRKLADRLDEQEAEEQAFLDSLDDEVFAQPDGSDA